MGGASRGVAGARASPQGAPNSPRETGPELEAKKPDRAPRHPPLGAWVSLLDTGRSAPIWGCSETRRQCWNPFREQSRRATPPPTDAASWHRWARAQANGSSRRRPAGDRGAGSGRPAGLSRPPFLLYMTKGFYSLLMSLPGLRLSVLREDFLNDET